LRVCLDNFQGRNCIAEHSRGEGPLVEAHGHVIRPADAAPREAVLDEVEWRI
jgi:hypothetical protein